ncbi:MAG: homoserine dehydrogenase [Thermoanaerobaculia bacterium]|nr:homoserine dehydrogenase [Thermoanaerobaculia bacterium]
MSRTVRIGLLGCGTVGGGLVTLLAEQHGQILERHGVDLELSRVLVRNPDKKRKGVEPALITTRSADILASGCDIVVELIGGVDDAVRLVGAALDADRSVVTANKALLAAHGVAVFAKAKARGLHVGFEASVCGGVPVIRALRVGLAGDSVESLSGILNGTCNYILTLMEEGQSFENARARAQELGFAEAEPSLDVDGHDALQKLTILSELAFGGIPVSEVSLAGIRDVTPADIRRARSRGQVIRHVAAANADDGTLRLSLRPELLAASHPLAAVRYENNGLVIRARAAGELTFLGRGAGALPTASAVLADIIDIAQAA